MSLDSMHKMLQNFNKKFARFKRECGKNSRRFRKC